MFHRLEDDLLVFDQEIPRNMTKQRIIDRTVNTLNGLPPEKVEEILTFVDFVAKRYEEQQLNQDIQKLSSASNAFGFLQDEDDLYSEADLKEVFNG